MSQHVHDHGDGLPGTIVARSAAVVGLAGIALIHVLDAHDAFESTPFKGWLYVGLIVSCLATAGRLIQQDDRRAWAAAFLFPLGALLAFVYSRTAGLPGGADDIGNWWEPLGLASLFVEGSVAALAASMLVAPLEAGARKHSAYRARSTASGSGDASGASPSSRAPWTST